MSATKHLRILICNIDGTLRDQCEINLVEVMEALRKDPRAIMDAADPATEMIRDEIGFACKAIAAAEARPPYKRRWSKEDL